MRRSITVLAVTTAAWLAAPSASASLWLILDRNSGTPGTVIHARTGGNGAFAREPGRSFALFLVPARSADAVTSRDDPSLVAVGRLSVDQQGNGHAVFRVPKVAPGPYLLMIDCPPCAPYSAGRTMLVVGPFGASAPHPFRVLPGPTADTSGTPFWPWLAAGAVAAAVAMWLVRRRRIERVGGGR